MFEMFDKVEKQRILLKFSMMGKHMKWTLLRKMEER